MHLIRSMSALLIMSLSAMAWGAESGSSEYLSALRATPDFAQGEARFKTCAMCHGSDGGGTEDGNVPRIAGQHFSVLVRQMIDYRHGERWDIRMENYTDRHVLANSQSIADVAHFVSQLQVTRRPGLGKGDLVDHGAKLYARSCRQCHVEAPREDVRNPAPQLGGQHYEYLLRQIYDVVDGRRPNMPRAHVRQLARLERDDITALADFLSRSPWITASTSNDH